MEKVVVPPVAHPEKPISDFWHGSSEFYGYKSPFPKARPLPEVDQLQARRAYLACVRYTDRQVGKVLDALDRLGLTESTIVVLWGDHGWHLGESQIWGKHDPFERAVQSPLIIRAPGVSRAAKNCEALVESTDIYPTLMDLCQLDFKGTQHPLDGLSLRPLLDGSLGSIRESAISYWENAVTIRTATHRLIAKRNGSNWSAQELYDMRQSPDPVENLVSKKPEIVSQMLGLLPPITKSN
jgi:arylsulfatase A-like enzyme